MLGPLFCQLFESSKKHLAVDEFELCGHERLQQDVVTELRSEVRGCGQKALRRFVALQYSQKCPHVISCDKVVGAVRFHLVDDPYGSKPTLDRNNISPEVSTPRRQCYFLKAGLMVSPGNYLLPLSVANLEREVRVLCQQFDNVEPWQRHCLNQLPFA